MRSRPELANGAPDETLARLADVATRRLVSVPDEFDDRNEELTLLALGADAVFLPEIAVVPLCVFVSLGWTRRASGRSADALLGRGLVEAARTPAQLVGAVLGISTMPMRSVAEPVNGARRHRPADQPRQPDDL